MKVHARFNPFEAETFRFEIARGQTVAEIVAACGPTVPTWFVFNGEVQVNGVPVPRPDWCRVVPAERDVITLHARFEGGGMGGGGTKNTIKIVAAIALIAAAAAISGGVLGPAAAGTIGTGLFGASFAAGGTGAALASLAVGVGASVLLATLTPPPLPLAKDEGVGQEQSSGGITANQLRPLDTLPAVLGKMRYSPPLLAPPYTLLTDASISVHAIVGLAGEYDKATLDASLLINGVSVDEFDKATLQVRYGTPADVPLTINNISVVEDPRNAELTNFVLEATAGSLNLMHQSDPDRDLPQWQYYKTAGDADEIRIRLNWIAGIGSADAPGEKGHMPIRVEIRKRGTVPWLKMPVTHFTDHKRGRAPVRKEIRLKFGTEPGGIRYNYGDNFEAIGVYYMTSQSSAWQYHAETYFQNTIPTDQIPVMTGNTTSGVTMSASAFNSGGPAWEAADNAATIAGWVANAGASLPQWIKVDFGAGNAKTIKSYLLSCGEPSAFHSWTLQGSNDDTNWTVIATVNNFTSWVTGGAFSPFWFQVDTPGNYRYYRVMITASGTDPAIRLADMQLALTDAPGNDFENYAPSSTNLFAKHANLINDGVEIYLDTATFPKGEYEVRVKRGLSDQVSSGVWDGRNYLVGGTSGLANFFDYYDNSGTWAVRRNQNSWGSQVIVEQFATQENVYPFDASIHTKGICMIAVEGESVKIDNLSAIFHSVVPIYSAAFDWTQDGKSSNPAALRRHVLLGQENALALPGEILNEEQHIEFFEHCAAEGHEFNAIVDGLSVAQVVQQIDAGGYGLGVYPSAQWGVIFDHDRSAEVPVQIFTPLNTRNMTVARDFAELPQAFRVQFSDEANDWNLVSPEPLVYMDGYNAGNTERIETLELPGFTNSAKAQARALFDIRQLYLRNAKYGFEIGIDGLVAERGDLVGLNHDVISRYHDFARIAVVTTSGGNVTGLGFEAQVDLGVAAGEVDSAMSAVIQLTDRTLRIKAVNEAAKTDTVSFVTPFAMPVDGDGVPLIVVGGVVGFGVVNTETKRCLVHTIEYVDLLHRRISLVDEAPALHA